MNEKKQISMHTGLQDIFSKKHSNGMKDGMNSFLDINHYMFFYLMNHVMSMVCFLSFFLIHFFILTTCLQPSSPPAC